MNAFDWKVYRPKVAVEAFQAPCSMVLMHRERRIEVNAGDFVVRFSNENIRVLSEEEFRRTYELSSYSLRVRDKSKPAPTRNEDPFGTEPIGEEVWMTPLET